MPTKPARVVDFGAHCYPETVFPDVYAGTAFQSSIGTVHHDVEAFTGLLQEGGIDAAVLSMPYYMGGADRDAIERANDALLEAVAGDERLYGLCSLPVAAGGDVAATELERCLEQGFHGGAVPTKVDSVELIDAAFAPVLETADRFGAPLLVHPKLHDSLHPDVLDDTYLLNAIFGREMALAESISKVIHTGVLEDYPDVRLVYHHLGGNLAAMLGRIHLQLDDGRWPTRQDHVKPFDDFVDDLRDRVYVDTSGFFGYVRPLETALDLFPPSNVLFGTDAPYEPRSPAELAEFVDTVERVVPDRAVEGVLGDNARCLLYNT